MIRNVEADQSDEHAPIDFGDALADKVGPTV